jgi:hypothetical protein
MKWILKITLFAICFLAVDRVCKSQTGSFTVYRITSNLSYQPQWETAPPENLAEIKKILQQPYSYFGKGVQSFAFVSQDGQYVIKFFRHDHMHAPFLLSKIPMKWARAKVAKKEAKFEREFRSYKLAYEILKKETGLVFLHLNKTSGLNQTLDLVDKLGIHHPIPLDNYEFLVQKRASLLYTSLNQMIENNRLDDAKETLSKLVRLLARRAALGISDKDPDLETNFGLIGTDPIQIDVGRFGPRTRPFDKNEIIRITDHLHAHLNKTCPELGAHLKTQIENL